MTLHSWVLFQNIDSLTKTTKVFLIFWNNFLLVIGAKVLEGNKSKSESQSERQEGMGVFLLPAAETISVKLFTGP